MREKLKKYRFYYISSIILVLLAIAGFSYAYFEGNITNDFDIDVNIKFDEGYTFKTSHSDDSVEAIISSLDMYWNHEDKNVYTNEQTITVELINDRDIATECLYDLVWVWDGNKDKYQVSSSGIREFSITMNSIESQLPNYSSNYSILQSAKITAPAKQTVTTEHEFTVKFYNLTSVDQSAHTNKTYSGSVKVENVECNKVAS
ncbi:MAG: hypothetical protein IJO63_04050 [Bacilli bacterium]|nr:hypothetical protein [Bacilli bacterium]